MNIKIMAALGSIVVLGGIGLLSTLDPDQVVTAESIKAGTGNHPNPDTMRLAVLDGTCPAPLKIPAECYFVHQAADRCICWTQQTAELDNEMPDQAHVPPAKRVRLIACAAGCKGPCPGPGVWWEKDTGNAPDGCVIAAQPNIYETMGDNETALVTQLRAACAPCPVTGQSWGKCPMCLTTAGGCAAACP